MTNVRLNPYYTGIHLHKNYHYELSRKKSLNPYYTGIHLHVLRCKEKVLTFVLILIILEYIYMLINVARPSSIWVLILIILEYIYIVFALFGGEAIILS